MLVYFAYGSNMNPDHMARWVPEARAMGPGRLDGYRLAFTIYSSGWQGGAANLEPDPSGHVWGVLWTMSEEGMLSLDTYEGHPTFYRREELAVTGPEGPLEAWTYRVAHQKGYVHPTDAYLHVVRAGIRLMGLPPEAFELLEEAARPPTPSIST